MTESPALVNVQAPSYETISVRIKKLRPEVQKWPQYETQQASGMDLKAAVDKVVPLNPGQRIWIPTGIAIELPTGFEAQIRPRSGLALKYGLTILNSPGTIDADYRGEIGIVLIHHGEKPFSIEPQMRIAQIVFCRVARATFLENETLSETERGPKGYGSTGL